MHPQSHSLPPNSTMILIWARRKLAVIDHFIPGTEIDSFTWINPSHASFIGETIEVQGSEVSWPNLPHKQLFLKTL